MRQKSLISILCVLLLSGCSVFKSASSKEDVQVARQQANDIVSQTLERVDIEIPPELFVRIYGLPSPPRDTTDTTISEDTARAPEGPTEPVRITINRSTNTQDNSVVTTDSTRVTENEETVEREPKGLFGFGGGFIIAIVLVAAGAIWLIIKRIF